MDEAEKLSDYVYIMDQGKIIADGTPEELIDNLGQENVIDFARNGLEDNQLAELKELYPEIKINLEEISVYVQDLSTALPALINWSEKTEFKLDNLKIRRPNLEDVFIELTGKGLRD